MRKLLFACAAAVLAGCASAQVEVRSGTAANGASAGLHIQSDSRSLATALIVLSLIGAGVEYNREPRPFPDVRELIPQNTGRFPELAPDRRIREQDCSKPPEDAYANLKCR